MKVLHILAELKPSGAETMLAAAGPLLKDYAISADVLCTGSQLGPFAGQLATAGYGIHQIPFQKHPRFFLQFFQFCRRGDYQVIHLHTERANFWLGLCALLSGKHCVRTIHNTFPFSGFLGWTRKWQRQLLQYLGLQHIAISDSVQHTEYKYYGLRLPIIQNWYNNLRFQPSNQQQRLSARAALDIALDSYVILTIGNCSEVKNHTALIQAMQLASKSHWLYLHVGIEKDCSERELAAELGISTRLRFCGLQTDILPFLQAADLFVMPSTYEGFGIAAIEAIATGLPALLTDVPGLADFQSLFRGVYYCQPEAESIASELAKINTLDQGQLHEQCSENPAIATLHFGIQRGLQNYLDFYKNQS